MTTKLKAVICENQFLFRDGLLLLLQEEGFDVVLCARSPDAIFPDLAKDSEDLLILLCEERLSPEMADAVSVVRRTYPSSKIVLMLHHYDSDERALVERLGVDGLLSKCISRNILMRSVELIMLGESIFSQVAYAPTRLAETGERASISIVQPGQVTTPAQSRQGDGPDDRPACVKPVEIDRPITEIEERAREVPVADVSVAELCGRRDRLSNREIEILLCLVEGQSNKMIARQCGITDATVKVHLKAILRKIKVQNRTQAAVWAMQKMAAGQLQAPRDRNADADGKGFGDSQDRAERLSLEKQERAVRQAAQVPSQMRWNQDVVHDYYRSSLIPVSTA